MGVMRTAWQTRSWQGTTATCVAILIACAGAGCQRVERTDVVAWREAVTTVGEHSGAVFQATNELVRDSRRDWLLTRPELEESHLRPGLDSAGVARWHASLRALMEYASAVEVLLSEATSEGVGASVRGLSERIGDAANSSTLRADGALANAIGRLGQRIADAAAGSSARDLMLNADADVRAVLNQMSDMLLLERDDVRIGVIPVIEVTWNTQLAQIEEQFRVASPEARAPIIARYAEVLSRRDRAVSTVLLLRGAMLNLATAHTAAANGRVGDVRGVIDQIRGEIAQVRSLIRDLQSERAIRGIGGTP